MMPEGFTERDLLCSIVFVVPPQFFFISFTKQASKNFMHSIPFSHIFSSFSQILPCCFPAVPSVGVP